jgi:hypothetical protein
MRAEIEEHLALETARNLSRGMPLQEARRQAILKFGAVQAISEDYRDQKGLPFMETLLQLAWRCADCEIRPRSLSPPSSRWPWALVRPRRFLLWCTLFSSSR